MKFLVIGLGSMGKRRVRCLKQLGYDNNSILGFDIRADRNVETSTKYNIKTYDDLDLILTEEKPDVFIISVPPDSHHKYIKIALNNKIHFFVEASVVATDMDGLIKMAQQLDVVAAPSATLLFHPAIEKIQEIILEKELGKISNIIYHSGQYLPDWHTYEKVKDYYVSNPSTGGGREIVPFELTWVTKLFGFPKRVCANFRKTINISGAEKIDDTYNFLMDYDEFLASITVDVVSRCATRHLLINGDRKQLRWDWDEQCINIFTPGVNQWDKIEYEMGFAEKGYNENIGENMYINEIKNFIDTIHGKTKYVNSLDQNYKILKLLYLIEDSDREGCYKNVAF